MNYAFSVTLTLKCQHSADSKFSHNHKNYKEKSDCLNIKAIIITVIHNVGRIHENYSSV